ncbi:MAG TPA: hypothetical protein VGU71_02750 [Candidatus Dormibacteraeota bacterium]|nr:hypothetical protein [Candidatus Dormibacteraeota bacterium]
MQITDIGLLGPGFERRLRAALDAVAPPTLLISNARYRSTRSSRPWRLASALVGIGAVGAVAVSAFAATGSPNPAVWTERAASSIQSVTHIPETSPNPPQSPIPDPRLNAPISQPTGTSHATSSDNPQPSHDAEESPPPDELLRPKGSPPPEAQKPSPSDSPDHHPEHDSKPSPPPHDQGGDSHGQ